MDEVTFRSATAADAAEMTVVYLASRRAFVGFAPQVYSNRDVERWMRTVLIPRCRVTLAVRRGRDIVGMMALSRDEEAGWVEQLYLDPSAIGQGIGSSLLDRAKVALGPPIRLYTFAANDRSRGFYERRGFRPIAFGDGSKNQEQCPDVLYEWTVTADSAVASPPS